MTETKPLLVRMSPEQRKRLDGYRASRGLRSDAEAVRHLIDHAQIAGVFPPEAFSQKPAEAKEPVSRGKVEGKVSKGATDVPGVSSGYVRPKPGALLKKDAKR